MARRDARARLARTPARPLAGARRLTARRWFLLAGLLCAVVAAGLAWALWPSHGPQPEPPRARQYRDVTACLLTDERGIAGPEAAPVWAGLQDASTASLVKVQYLAVSGPQTVPDAEPFLASLVQGRCSVVFAVGSVPVGAVASTASRFPSARFVVIGGGTGARNVTVLNPPPGDVRTVVKQQVTAIAGR